MLKEFLFFIKYPYTAGVIATIWIGSAFLMLISRGVSSFRIVLINLVVTVIIALIGFGGHSDA
jgi:hypothetical protein